METEVESRTGAAKGVRSPLREAQRNGYRKAWIATGGLLRSLILIAAAQPALAATDRERPPHAGMERTTVGLHGEISQW